MDSQSNSINKNDGLILTNAYISAIVKCAPPDNKPTPEEIKTCSPYFIKEIKLLKKTKIILCLGGLAFNTFIKASNHKKFKFYHGAEYVLPDGKILLASYHPSRQNTQTGKLKWNEWIKIFDRARQTLIQNSQ